METKEQNALWHFNSARMHDGLLPLQKLPKGFIFTPFTPTKDFDKFP
jgi:hypothetical protein